MCDKYCVGGAYLIYNIISTKESQKTSITCQHSALNIVSLQEWLNGDVIIMLQYSNALHSGESYNVNSWHNRFLNEIMSDLSEIT